MLHMQSPYLPAAGAADWSSEITVPDQMPDGQTTTTTRQTTHGQTTTSQVTTRQTIPGQALPGVTVPGGTGTNSGTGMGGGTGADNGGTGQVPGQTGAGQGMPAGGTAPQRIDPVVRPAPASSVLDLRNNLPQDVIQSPTTLTEAQMGSMKAVLGRNLGNFVVATFLVGTQGTTSWEGVLYDVGNDYLIIYQMGRDRYVVCDIYSLKYIEFYDTRRQEMCESLIRDQGWQNNGWQSNN